jgi:deoxyribose-phosphate aldolase
MIDAGADRIGTSAGVKLVKMQQARRTPLKA